MADDSVIADVGQSLVDLLRDRMGRPRNEIALASPGTVGDGDRLWLTLYLYRVVENADLKNSKRLETGNDLRDPPLALDLYYLLTAHPSGGNDDETALSMDQHRVLGHAMQVLHDNAVLRGSELSDSLANSEEEVRITMDPMDSTAFDQTLSMWSTFQERPYQPSVPYLVSPILIDSARTRPARRVLEKEDRYYDGVDRE